MILRVSLFFLLLMGFATSSTAQIEEPVKWTFEHEKIAEGDYLLKCIATMEDGWYIYAQDNPNPDGPVPTSFEWKQRKSYQFISDVEEVGDLIDKFDPFFETQVKKYGNQVIFQRKVRSTKAVDRIRGELEFMCCNDEKCLPPTPVKFSFTVGKDDEGAVAAQGQKKPESDSKAGLTAQKIEDPVEWSYDWVELLDGSYEIRVKAKIEDGWYVYSQDNNPDEGPKPTVFNFDESDQIEWLDEKVIEEGKLKSGMDPVFNVNVNKYAHELMFTRKVKLLDPDAVVSGEFEL